MSDHYDDLYRQRGADEAFRIAADDARKLHAAIDEIQGAAAAAGWRPDEEAVASWLRRIGEVFQEARSTALGTARVISKSERREVMEALRTIDAGSRREAEAQPECNCHDVGGPMNAGHAHHHECNVTRRVTKDTR